MCPHTPEFKTFRVTVIEWMSRTTVIEAPDRDAAIEEARRLWLGQDNEYLFEFDDSDLETVIADEVWRRNCNSTCRSYYHLLCLTSSNEGVRQWQTKSNRPSDNSPRR